jgi:uncharacterized protein YlxW (UPF0749 family)
LKIEKLVFALLAVVVFNSVIGLSNCTKEKTYSRQEVETLLKLDSLQNKINILQLQKKALLKTVKNYEKSIKKDSSFVWDSNSYQLDSLRAIYNPQ